MTLGDSLDTRRVAGALGAEITGLRLAPDLPDDVVAYVRSAILEHKVVFLHGQDHLDDATHAGFVRRLGPLTTAHPTVAGGLDEAAILPVDSARGNKANSWHTDVTFVDRPPAFTTLRAQVLPPYGGDTVFANTARAYATLPEHLRRLVDELWAEHTNAYDYATSHDVVEASSASAEYQAEFTSAIYKTRHPVVRVHPETGEPAFVLGQFVSRLLEVTGKDSHSLFEMLQRHITRLENTVRWRWSPGDVALWDNRATQHYAVDDYDDLPRRMHRVTVAGDVPVSRSGQHSIAIAGDSGVYAGSAGVAVPAAGT